jgi:hypothetical protein
MARGDFEDNHVKFMAYSLPAWCATGNSAFANNNFISTTNPVAFLTFG